jgi:hypothetical protein
MLREEELDRELLVLERNQDRLRRTHLNHYCKFPRTVAFDIWKRKISQSYLTNV